MSNIIYTSIPRYLEDCTTIEGKIARLEAIVLSMMTALETSVLTGHFDEYKFDDGQSRIETVYRDPKAVTNAILQLENLIQFYRNMLINRKGGRVMRMMDRRNFTRRWPY
jgi:conjugal transfer/entry exclusion protein